MMILNIIKAMIIMLDVLFICFMYAKTCTSKKALEIGMSLFVMFLWVMDITILLCEI